VSKTREYGPLELPEDPKLYDALSKLATAELYGWQVGAHRLRSWGIQLSRFKRLEKAGACVINTLAHPARWTTIELTEKGRALLVVWETQKPKVLGTVTGRLSTDQPNIQNIGRHGLTRLGVSPFSKGTR
jgi:hypothetical protein